MSTRKPATDMLTTSQAAALLGLHMNTVVRWSNQGILPYIRINERGDRRFRRSDINNFIAKRSA